MKKIIALVLGLSLIAALSACGGKTEGNADNRTEVRIATNNRPNPPFSFTGDDGKPAGYTIEYLKEIEKKLPEYKFIFEPVDAQSMLLGVDSGKYAFAANYYFKNPEREQKYLFADTPYGYSVTGLIVKSNRNDITSLDDLHGKKLVPETPNSGLYYIIKDYNLKNPDKQVVNETIDQITDADSLKYVASGQYDVDFINVHNFYNANKQLNLGLKVAGIISKEPVWVLFNQSQTELASKFEKATQELIADGTLPELAKKWFDLNFFQSLEELRQGYTFRAQ